jgi:hypothetical protein
MCQFVYERDCAGIIPFILFFFCYWHVFCFSWLTYISLAAFSKPNLHKVINGSFHIYIINCRSNFDEIRYESSVYNVSQPFWYITILAHTNPTLNRSVNVFLHITQKPFYKYCNSIMYVNMLLQYSFCSLYFVICWNAPYKLSPINRNKLHQFPDLPLLCFWFRKLKDTDN